MAVYVRSRNCAHSSWIGVNRTFSARYSFATRDVLSMLELSEIDLLTLKKRDFYLLAPHHFS